MPTIDFPTGAAIGDTYNYLGRIWQWDGSGWERLINSGQIVSVFVMPGVEVKVEADSIPYTIDGSWHLINYV